VEHVWARRKVGYLLDQIRANGEKKELVEETVALAKKYGIATPYTSYLIVPDAPVPVVGGALPGGGQHGRPNVALDPKSEPAALAPGRSGQGWKTVAEFAKGAQNRPAALPELRGRLEEETFEKEIAAFKNGDKGKAKPLQDALEKKQAYDQARTALKRSDRDGVQSGKLGVDLSVQMYNLRNQSRLEQTAQRNVCNRNCLEIGGIWIDEAFDSKMPTLTIQAMSDAYFRILERHPQIKEVFQLGNYLVWVAPNGTALIVDTKDGKEKLEDAEIDRLFVAKK
jgi:Ca-activated chloride channel family protein